MSAAGLRFATIAGTRNAWSTGVTITSSERSDSMAEPITPERGACFDLAAIARDMRASEAYRNTGHTARTIVREPDLRIVLVVMRAGSVIKEHKADDTTSVQALTGHMHLRLPHRVAALATGALLVLERGLPHTVEADEDSTFLLTLGGRPAR